MPSASRPRRRTDCIPGVRPLTTTDAPYVDPYPVSDKGHPGVQLGVDVLTHLGTLREAEAVDLYR